LGAQSGRGSASRTAMTISASIAGDVAGSRRIMWLAERSGVCATTVQLAGEIIGFACPTAADVADIGIVPISSFHITPQPIKAFTSNFAVHAAGAAPIAMTKATAPSILPIDRFFESFLLPASPRSITEFAMHMVKTG
jgi:hypothetical protein